VPPLAPVSDTHVQLVLVFAGSTVLLRAEVLQDIRTQYPAALLLGCSTAGEICGTQVFDDSLALTAICFAHSQVRGADIVVTSSTNSLRAGEMLGEALPHSAPAMADASAGSLAHVLVLSDGLNVNGSDLIRGLSSRLPEGVSVTGGLAGDGARFKETLVFGSGVPQSGGVAAVGLYGHRLKIGFGSMGGWEPFGPDRLVTRSEGNVLLELDGRPALALYKQYLGEHAQGLPATGLLFPLSVRGSSGSVPVVRTVFAVDEQRQSMTFAGDIAEGAYVRLSKASIERLVDGAIGAARTCSDFPGAGEASLAILISCVGRKLVLKQRVEEEVEGVREVLGEPTALTGFYSYGEIAPFGAGATCELHNQTMTITTFAEN
jgi:hypothetical protein